MSHDSRIFLGNLTPAGINMFNNLRRLELIIFHMYRFNELTVAPFLDMCPLLEELHLQSSHVYAPDKGEVGIIPNLQPTKRSTYKSSHTAKGGRIYWILPYNGGFHLCFLHPNKCSFP